MRTSPAALSFPLLLWTLLASSTNGQWRFNLTKREGDMCGRIGGKIWTCRRESECGALKYLYENGYWITCSDSNGVHSICCPPVPIRIKDPIIKTKCAEYQALNTCGFKQPRHLKVIRGRNKMTHPFRGENSDVESITAAKGSEREGDAYSEYGGPDDPDDTDDVAGLGYSDFYSTMDYPNELRIMGGIKSAAGKYPHMALIGFGDEDWILKWVCGGTLISERWVVSAAHCIDIFERSPNRVRLGDLDHEKAEDDAHVQQFKIVERHAHKNFKPPAMYNDIALYKLDRPAVFNKFVAPACLYQGTGEPKGLGTATGWGYVEPNLQKSELMEVDLKFIDPKECRAKYIKKSKLLPLGIDGHTMICAWGQGKDTCQGDSGGPLVLADKGNNCLHQLVGIISFGTPGCKGSLVPGIYVRVSAYIPWIESIVWPTN